MPHRLFAAIILVLLATGTVYPVFAQAEADKPLLIVRFNQPRVNFDSALSQAIPRAEQARQNISYEIVSFMPQRFSKDQARANLKAVVGGMQQNGASLDRIHWRSEMASGEHQEIHIFVN